MLTGTASGLVRLGGPDPRQCDLPSQRNCNVRESDHVLLIYRERCNRVIASCRVAFSDTTSRKPWRVGD